MRGRHAPVLALLALVAGACDRGLPSPTPREGPGGEPPAEGALPTPEPLPLPLGGPAAPRAQAGKDGRVAIEGRWRGDREEVELFPTGRLLLKRGASRGLGRWEWVETDRILIAYEGVLAGAVPGDYRVALAGDVLRLCETDDPDRCMRFTRWTPDDPPPPGTRSDAGPPRLALPPRSDQIPQEARMLEARGILKQAHVLQQVYRAERGEYAPNLFELRSVGWQDPVLRHFHPPRLIREGERYCVVAEPRTPDLWPLYVDETGEIRQGRDCP